MNTFLYLLEEWEQLCYRFASRHTWGVMWTIAVGLLAIGFILGLAACTYEEEPTTTVFTPNGVGFVIPSSTSTIVLGPGGMKTIMPLGNNSYMVF